MPQCFITDHGKALEELYGDEEVIRKGDECLTAMANRIATVFASMLVRSSVVLIPYQGWGYAIGDAKYVLFTCLLIISEAYKLLFLQEFPFVRYRAAKSLDPTTMTTFCDLVPTKLAAAVWNCLMRYKSLNNFPQIETCELLILDRSIDQVFSWKC